MRLLKGLGALVLTTAISIGFLAPRFIDWLAWPAGGLDAFIAIEVTETMGVYMRVSLLSGFIMALPLILYQVLAFIVPGLYDNEKKWLYLSIPLATLLFIIGVAFAYFVMLPAALPFLSGFLEVTPSWRISKYIEFVTNLMFWIGMSFETPLLVFILAKLKIVTPAMLLKQWRFAIVIIAILAAMITPTVDPVNMALLMIPLFAIYMLSVLFATFAR
jgi:sec-independent protein translocase protein TatC